ncbi:MAG: copper chaperone PCu(A)C [Caldilineaceae bacterium]|nr:copper chaperone PCu(A)C [Caldilineaceae bacterium]
MKSHLSSTLVPHPWTGRGRTLVASVLFLAMAGLAACVAPVQTPPAPRGPVLAVEDVWSQPAVLLESMTMPASAAESTPCPSLAEMAQFVDPCEGGPEPMPCATPEEQMEGHAMGATDSMETVAATGTRGVIYLTITNSGDAPDRLLGIETGIAAAAELHHTTMDQNGVMRMRPVTEGLEVPAGGQVRLEPGSYHVMLIDLQQNLSVGDRFPVVLHFERSRAVNVESEVRLP